MHDLIEDTLAQGVPELFIVEEQYRLAVLAAESSFVTGLIARITDPQDGWGSMWAEFHGEGPPVPER
jgi:hypothetical protein